MGLRGCCHWYLGPNCQGRVDEHNIIVMEMIMFENWINVVDFWASYRHGGKIGSFWQLDWIKQLGTPNN